MQRLIIMILLVALFSSCLNENKLDMMDTNGVTEGDFIYDNPDKYLLSHNQVSLKTQSIFLFLFL